MVEKFLQNSELASSHLPTGTLGKPETKSYVIRESQERFPKQPQHPKGGRATCWLPTVKTQMPQPWGRARISVLFFLLPGESNLGLSQCWSLKDGVRAVTHLMGTRTMWVQLRKCKERQADAKCEAPESPALSSAVTRDPY